MGGSRAIGDDYRLQHELSGSLSPYMEPRLVTRFRAFSDADGVPIFSHLSELANDESTCGRQRCTAESDVEMSNTIRPTETASRVDSHAAFDERRGRSWYVKVI
ncbi:hypothetical protein PGT21_020965 [Puccinia graminis f. sp. tritici]|uniref:Uncharacterized protein n=1 Tax=Puccinia graminis f. sp. tritici TaxID=56615 RepID=A0A5B0LL84_PUCGR|nr:hypothetical protein PGT21_020965 [Puccinia graminis f. sp. tritici]